MKTFVEIKGQISSVNMIAGKMNCCIAAREGRPRHYGDKVICLYYHTKKDALDDIKKAWRRIKESCDSLSGCDRFNVKNGTLSYDAAVAEIKRNENG